MIDSQRGRRGGERGEEEVLFWGRARLARKYRVMDSHRGGGERGKESFVFWGFYCRSEQSVGGLGAVASAAPQR